MNGYPRSQLPILPHTTYGGRQTMPFHTGWFGYEYDQYGFLAPPMPHSYFGRAENGVVNGYHSAQPTEQVPNAVQSYLDINCNENGRFNDLVEDLSLSKSSFHCEQCKKSFQDKNSLGAHLKTHVKCEFPNCSFVASRQTLKLHEIQCHRDGKMKITLDTPEQIAKWREERKRRYPSVTNVARKEAEHQRKIESGQIVKTKEFRYNRKQGWKQQRGKRDNKRGRNIQQRSNGPSKESQHVKVATTDLLHEEQNTKCTLQSENLLDLYSKDTECNKKETKETSRELSNLGALAAAYATSSCDEDENDGNDLEQKDDIDKPMQSEHCQKPEYKKQKLTEINDKNVDKGLKRKDNQDRSRRKRKQNIIGPNRPRPTLLEMLLAPDIRHERNVMLQCIRFILKKDFFGLECKENT